MKRQLLLLPIILFLASCGGKNEKKESSNKDLKTEFKKDNKVNLKAELIGKWRNSNIKVTMKTANGDSVLEATNKTWKEVMKIKPIVTTFKKNGTFKSVYKTLDNQIIMTREGSWTVKKDSLFMTSENITTSYKVKFKGNIAFFKGVLDWDQDGEVDDLYFGRQTKLVKKKSTDTKKENS